VTDLVDHHEPTHEAFLRNLARTCDRIADAAAPFIEQASFSASVSQAPSDCPGRSV